MMASQVSVQDVLNALGGPLVEKSLWALLYQSHSTLKKAIEESDTIPTLLITPETMLLSRGGSIQILPGIPRSSSIFSAPEQCNSKDVDIEKCYIYSLGMTLLTAMRNELEDQMNPQVSEVQHEFLTSMTNKSCDHRPFLEEILKHCSYYFESQSQASEEVDKLVSYVLGPTLESYSDSEDYKIDEADLEAEIQQVINLRGTGSIENLYPPSYGSRGSSSLSLGSSGGYQRSFSVNVPRLKNMNMYSSLPMVFTSHDVGIKKHAHNHSDDRLAPSCSRQESNYLKSDGKQHPTETKLGYGSHFYTPLRGRRVERKTKGNNQRKQTQLHLSLFRSSSDGKKKSLLESDPFMNTPSLLTDDIPPLPPKSVDVTALITTNSEISSLSSEGECLQGGNLPTQLETSSALDSSFDYSIPNTSLRSDSHTNEFDFPSPPPLPVPGGDCFDAQESLNQKQSEEITVAKDTSNPNAAILFERHGSFDKVAPISDEPLVAEDTKLSSCSTLKCDSEEMLNDHEATLISEPITPSGPSIVPHRSSSLKKLSDVFGPEFIAINGLQQEKKSARVSIPTDRRIVEVVMLDNCTIRFVVELTSTCRELFNQVVAHQSLEETHIFGLATIQDSSELFLESDRKLLKYAPEGWSKNGAFALKNSLQKFTVFFRVKYYVENVNQLRLNQTRHLYYLQLRKDVLESKIYCHEQSALKLAAYSLQAEKGDKRSTDTPLYFRTENFLSSKVINKLGMPVIQSILPGMHSELKGQNREAAELNYLKEVQTLAEYGMVFYEVATGKRAKLGSVCLGLSVRGLVVYNVHKGVKTPSSHWPWKKIRNLSFVNRRFLIEVEDHRTLSFYTDSYKRARYLLHLSVNYHRFQLLPGGPTETHSNDTPHHSTTPIYNGVQVSTIERSDKKQKDILNSTAHKADKEQRVNESLQDFNPFHSSRQLPDGNTIPIELEKVGGVIGLRLAGGRNKAIGNGFIYIKLINEGSIAAKKNLLKERDLLLRVNEQDTFGMTHKEAAALILSSDSPISMLFHRPYEMNWSEKVITSHDQPDSAIVKRDESWTDLTLANVVGKTSSTSHLNSITEEILAANKH